jgi:PPOX class probable F420-dependent enzyme
MSIQSPSPAFTELRRAKYMSLTTFRKNGEPVVTPVWFAEDAGSLYLFTFPEAGKVKRIRHTARVTVAPCTLNGKVTGPTIEAQARILTDEPAKEHADQTLARKYGLTWRIYNAATGAMRALRRKPKSERVYVAIEPAR